MVSILRGFAAVAAGVLMVAGCSASAPAATLGPVPAAGRTLDPAHTDVALATPRSSATPGPSPAPGAAASPTPGAAASPFAFHADPILEAMLPDQVGGEAVHVETVLVRDYLQLLDPGSEPSAQLRRFLLETGTDPELVSVAFATYGTGPDARLFQAYRAPGGRPDRLLAATVYLMRSATGAPEDATVATTRIGSHTVTTVSGAGVDPVVVSVFVEGELAIVTAVPPDEVAALLDALP